jgi:hypothetical protein
MRTAEQEPRELVVVTADSQQKRTVATLLLERWRALGIRQLAINADSDIYSLQNDPGVFHRAGGFLAVFARQYEYALVLLDAEWEGGPASAEEIEAKIQDDLNRSGWEGRSAVVVIDPELEIWVWSTSPHVPRLFGTDWETIKDLGHRKNYWKKGEIKPSRPKELLEEVLRRTRKRRSAALYRQLARKVGLRTCRDDSFCRFREILQQWFPA